MCPVRPFVEDDIPQVAELCWKFLLRRQGLLRLHLNSFLHELCFVNPWVDSSSPSLVDETKSGRIVGFLSVITRQMSLRRRTHSRRFWRQFCSSSRGSDRPVRHAPVENLHGRKARSFADGFSK